MTEIRTEGERLRTETTRLNDARTRLAGLMEAKKLRSPSARPSCNAVRAAAAEISESVTDLDELISQARQGGDGQHRARRLRRASENGAITTAPPPPAIGRA